MASAREFDTSGYLRGTEEDSAMTAATVVLSTALLCVYGHCYPALVGPDTPIGTYAIHERVVDSPGYGGDVLEFKETDRYVFAIHRVWLLHPQEHRLQILLHGDAGERRRVTKGCINVMPDVYNKLKTLNSVNILP
jgi:hypothetical protein